MVTMQISVSEKAAKSIERRVCELQFAGPSEYIEGLVEADQDDELDGDLEYKKWLNEQLREALESDPANDIEGTPEYWERKHQELEAMIASRGVSS